MWAILLPAAVLSCWAVSLVLIDVTSHRLPDPLTLPAAASAVATSALLAPGVAVAGLIWPALYLLVGLLVGGVGGGDIKLAVSLGILVAAVAGVPGVLVAMVLAGLTGVVAGAVDKQPATAHGPPMILAAAVVLGVGVVW